MEYDTNPQTALVRSGPVDNQDEVQFQSTSQNRENAHNLTSPVGGYEEFFGGTIPCPSCRGAGRIPREKENQLVALIPLSDKRLKPSRTLWYVLLAVVVCTLIGGLLAYFLFPHSIQLLSNSPTLQPTYLYVNTTEELVNMTIVNEYNVTNHNYYGVNVNNLSVTLTFDQHIIARSVNNTLLYVPLKSTRQLMIKINLTFSGDEGYIANYCARKIHRSHTVLIPFEATLKSTYFGGTFENTLTTYQHVRCSNNGYLK
ncbi:hypothetical protein LSH36_1058g00004 [Paralvinella palmiformis]|uniref:Transmembrane protein 106B n=1 Tax=Paralvinella palmiformis TaxID=53620 RepID=A0AAD9IWP5_9ANNE|nr:hypothetical protein LSH36_1058g00004 [Paralvinella palmiformis]